MTLTSWLPNWTKREPPSKLKGPNPLRLSCSLRSGQARGEDPLWVPLQGSAINSVDYEDNDLPAVLGLDRGD